MGNYQTTQSTDNSAVFQPVVTDENTNTNTNKDEVPEQESKLYNEKIMYAIIKNDEEFLYSKSIENAKSYVNSCINIDFESNFGERIFVDQIEYENMIVYTLNKVDPTSLFCKSSFYRNYKILFCKAEVTVDDTNKLKDD
jgi:hypothetical protein